MAAVQITKPLSSRTVKVMKPGDKIKADTGENNGLQVKYGVARPLKSRLPKRD